MPPKRKVVKKTPKTMKEKIDVNIKNKDRVSVHIEYKINDSKKITLGVEKDLPSRKTITDFQRELYIELLQSLNSMPLPVDE